MALKLHNSLSRRLEDFQPLEPGRVRMYVCGPTVYDLLHLGNGRTFLFWDVARRYLQWRGYAVTYVQNFTDVDDKIIHRANAEGVAPEAITQRYTEAYFEDMDALGVRRADQHPTATGSIPLMVAHIEGLIAKGLAYATAPREGSSGGDVYFRVRQFQGYGKLSGRDVDELRSGARVEVDEATKEDPLDFALWKGAKPGEPSWESPWGPGRPGWHIECSAMVRAALGDTIDLHAGGMDLKFPHHENEIAQSEGLTGQPFCRCWLHTGFLNFGEEKMSKSLGNVRTTRDMVAHYGREPLRAFLLSTHYRQELACTDEAIVAAGAGWKRLRESLAELEGDFAAFPESPAAAEWSQAFEASVQEAMDADLNAPKALSLFNTQANRLKRAAKAFAKGEAFEGSPPCDLRPVFATMRHLSEELFGLELTPPPPEPPPAWAEAPVGQVVAGLVAFRTEAKAEGAWPWADALRQALSACGVELRDRKDGSVGWRAPGVQEEALRAALPGSLEALAAQAQAEGRPGQGQQLLRWRELLQAARA